MTSKIPIYKLFFIVFWSVIFLKICFLEGLHTGHLKLQRSRHRPISLQNENSRASAPSLLFSTRSPQDEARIESIKSGVAGGVAGAIALAPMAALHDIAYGEGTVVNGLAQWEFDTDMGVLQAALFAIVYRYCIRQDNNPMLNQGVIAAFIAVRALSKVQIPGYCSSLPLDCGEPLGFFDWNVLSQVGWGVLESVALFGVTAAAMDYFFSRGIISKFRG